MNTKLIENSKKINNLLVFQYEKFKDERGTNYETINNQELTKILEKTNFPEKNLQFQLDSFSESHKNVLRGGHGDLFNWKLITVHRGEIYFVVVDLNKESPTFGKWDSFILNGNSCLSILVPPQVVNFHLVTSEEQCLFHYKWSFGYIPIEQQISLRWHDARTYFGVEWPEVKTLITSERDK